MRIELVTDGGFAAFPGLAAPIALDDAKLPADRRAELQRLLNLALAEKAVHGAAKAAPVPDARRYKISIQRDAQRYELDAADPMVPSAFASLMKFVRDNGAR